MGPLRFHTTANNSGRMICFSRAFIKAQRAFPTTDVSWHVFVSSFATKALIYLIHNVILFSKCRGGLFPVMDLKCTRRRKISSRTSALQLLQTKLRFAMAASPSTNHTYSNTSCRTSSGRLVMCKLLPIIRYE